MPKHGKIIPNGVVLKEHELSTVVLLTSLGFDVELIPKSNIKCIAELQREFAHSKTIKRLKIITKNRGIIDWGKE